MYAQSTVMNPPASTGLPRPRAVTDQCEPTADSRPVALAWITDELIAEHRRVWSSRYRRTISQEEAIEIIMNIKRFAESVLDATGQERRP